MTWGDSGEKLFFGIKNANSPFHGSDYNILFKSFPSDNDELSQTEFFPDRDDSW